MFSWLFRVFLVGFTMAFFFFIFRKTLTPETMTGIALGWGWLCHAMLWGAK